jgi:hypothetical protein
MFAVPESRLLAPTNARHQGDVNAGATVAGVTVSPLQSCASHGSNAHI